jgi:hypothetical protein
MLQLGPSRVVTSLTKAERKAYREQYRRNAWIHLPNFIEPKWLSIIQSHTRPEHFRQKDASVTNCRNILKDVRWSAMMGVLLSQMELFDLVEEISAPSEPVQNLSGSIVSLYGKGDHYVDWHQDPPCLPGKWADATLIVNIGGKYLGGETEIKRPGSGNELWASISIPRAGDAFLFRSALTHRSAPVRGSRPKVSFIGWFSLLPSKALAGAPKVLRQLAGV